MTHIVQGYGAVTAGLLVVLGVIHLYWAARGIKGRSVALPEKNGRPVMQPSRASTVAVAAGLFAGALTLLARLGLVRLPVPPSWPRGAPGSSRRCSACGRSASFATSGCSSG